MPPVKVMIVDDEDITRDGLINGICWSKYDIEIAGGADNGMDAYLKAQELSPDIVVTDIRMSVMDGLELTRNLKEMMPFIRVIIISGYQEFEYAKQAISYGVEDYLIKPLDEAELINKILKISKEIEEDRKEAYKKNLDYLMLKQNMPFMHKYQELESKLLQQFKLAQLPEIENTIDEIYELFAAEDMQYYKAVCMRQLLNMREILDYWGLDSESIEIDFIIDNELCRYEKPLEIKDWQKDRVREFINMYRINSSYRFKKVVSEVESFIEKNYDRDITLKDASSRVFISPQYLSRIFREEKGVTFIEWLNLYRIEKAKAILASNDEKITNVSGLVGYNDYKYFSNVFKKYTGVTPRDYRKGTAGI